MTKALKVLVLFEVEGPPPEGHDYRATFKSQRTYWKTELEIIRGLIKLGHEVIPIGVFNNVLDLVNQVQSHTPDIVFNLTEHFNKLHSYDRNIAGLLELLGVPYTGSGPVALANCKNKAIAKKLLGFHRIKNPPFVLYPKGQKVKYKKELKFPIFVKPLHMDSSYGISQASLVENEKDLRDRITFIHDHIGQEALAESYIDGREYFVSLLGETRLRTFPMREIIYTKVPEDEPKFLTFRAKWNEDYQKKWGIQNVFAKDVDEKLLQKIHKACKTAYRVLQLSGYARIDLRVTAQNEIYIIEVNPNPALGREDDFMQSLLKSGLSYDQVLQKILQLGLGERRV